MKKINVCGFLTAQTPVFHTGVDDAKNKKGKNSAEDTEDKNTRPFCRISFIVRRNDGTCGCLPVTTISPNHFRGALRDACAAVVWEKLPDDARDLYAHRLLFSGGYQQEKSKDKSSKNSTSPAAVREYLAKSLFVDMWGGHTQLDHINLVPSRVKTFILPCWKGLEYLWNGPAQDIKSRVDRLKEAVERAEGPEYASFIEGLLNKPPAYWESVTTIPVMEFDSVMQQGEKCLIDRYKNLYKLDKKVLSEFPSVANLLSGRNYQKVEVLAPGSTFLCALDMPLPDDGEQIQLLEAGCILEGLRRFAERPFLGGKTAAGFGIFEGIFLAYSDGRDDRCLVLRFNGLKQILGSVPEWFGSDEELQAALNAFRNLSGDQVKIFLDPDTRPDALEKELSKIARTLKGVK